MTYNVFGGTLKLAQSKVWFKLLYWWYLAVGFLERGWIDETVWSQEHCETARCLYSWWTSLRCHGIYAAWSVSLHITQWLLILVMWIF